MSAGEASYDVEAQVRVLHRARDGKVGVLANGMTTFRVYGPPPAEEPPADAPADAPSDAPADAPADTPADETGAGG